VGPGMTPMVGEPVTGSINCTRTFSRSLEFATLRDTSIARAC